MNFNEDDKIIWDSGFGYEIGVYVGEGIFEHTHLVKFETGILSGNNVSHKKSEIFPYSKELKDKLDVKYRYM